MVRITLNGSLRKAINTIGFLKRMSSNKGKKIIQKRRKKNRFILCKSIK